MPQVRTALSCGVIGWRRLWLLRAMPRFCLRGLGTPAAGSRVPSWPNTLTSPWQVASSWTHLSTASLGTPTPWSMRLGTAWASTTSSEASRKSSLAATPAWRQSPPMRLETSAVIPTHLRNTSSAVTRGQGTTRVASTASSTLHITTSWATQVRPTLCGPHPAPECRSVRGGLPACSNRLPDFPRTSSSRRVLIPNNEYLCLPRAPQGCKEDVVSKSSS